MEVREISRGRHRWERIAGPTSAWMRNRWNWRRRRRMAEQIESWRTRVRPLDELDLEQLDPDTRRIAMLVEGLGHSRVLDLGCGMGEAIIVAAQRDPARLRPLIAAACEYQDDELRGQGRSTRTAAAIRARQAVISAARDVVAEGPETGPSDIAPA